MQGIDGTGPQDDRFQQAYLENNLSGAALATFKELRKKPNMQDFASLVAGMKTTFQEGRDSKCTKSAPKVSSNITML